MLAEHRAALSEERRAAEGKEPVKKAKTEKEREDKVVENLMAAIERRRTIGLDRLINALGIRHVGETTARLLARRYLTLDAFLEGDDGRRMRWRNCSISKASAGWWRKPSMISSTSRTM